MCWANQQCLLEPLPIPNGRIRRSIGEIDVFAR
jgi:hypothetical protein